jgi:hypothetical protein
MVVLIYSYSSFVVDPNFYGQIVRDLNSCRKRTLGELLNKLIYLTGLSKQDKQVLRIDEALKLSLSSFK